MSFRTILVVLAALACGASAAVGVIVSLKQQPVVPLKTEALLIAVVDVPRGHLLTAEEVRVDQWPEGKLPQGVLTQAGDATDRPTLVPLVAGEPIFKSQLAAKDSARGLAARIPKGMDMRAFTIQAARAESTVGGFALPGDRVDVLLNLRSSANDESGGSRTTALLQSVEVLAVGKQTDTPADNKLNAKELESVTLLVTLDQAIKLEQGQSAGQLSLALRNGNDRDTTETHPTTLAEVSGRPPKPVEPPRIVEKPVVVEKPPLPPAGPSGIVVLRGTQHDFIEVPTK